MSASALPHRRLSDIDARIEAAAARPVIIPDTIVVDHGKVFMSRNFRASCAYLGISLQPARKATGTDKPHIERTLGSVASLFAQFAAGYTGRSPEYRGRGAGQTAAWLLTELQELLDEWIIRPGRTGRTTGSATRFTQAGRSPRTRSTPRWSRRPATCRSP
jgi:hypothetical protein